MAFSHTGQGIVYGVDSSLGFTKIFSLMDSTNGWDTAIWDTTIWDDV